MDPGQVRTLSHVVAMPYPGRGHVNPMLNLCKLLASRDLLITFVVTEEWLGFIGSEPTPPNIRFRSIPNVIPSEQARAADFAGFFEAVFTKMETPFEQLLERLEPKPSWIVADTYLPWMVGVGKRRNIPVASLFTMSASVFSVSLHYDLIIFNRHNIPAYDLTERGDERIDYIPGITSIRLEDLHSIVRLANLGENTFENDKNVLKRFCEAASCATKAQCLLFTSFYEIEPHAVDTLSEKLTIPVYCIGPSIPYIKIQDSHSMAVEHNDGGCYNWLDSQPRESVLYVSFGSFLPVSSTQMDEFAMGLNASRVHFIWVARGEASRLQALCGEMGLVVPWCDQLRVLCHSSVGGFLTHCGWNSTLEGVFSGVPMLTFPLFTDQYPNSKLIVEDWKVGIRVKREVVVENKVTKEEIAESVQRLMDLNGDVSKELRRRAKVLKETCKKALGKDGSSYTNLNAFVRDVEQGHN
ncbi:UDP-glycosyltransferase 87A1-like [Tasmannia lanceolata]|uniref:UDP-glycosyltransferase 87A1-like n=1 Tax=Tasmannia lanceolata TaxID=3420 RepID=UPI004063AE15